LVPKDTKRADIELLQAINSVLGAHPNLDQMLSACEEASIFYVGGRSRLRRPKGRGKGGDGDVDEDGDAADAPGVPVHWNILVAEALSKVGLQLQKALLEERIISFIVEWCDTPMIKNAGVAYVDCCIEYDKGDIVVRHVEKSPANNIYCRIPHPLLDPVLDDAENLYRRFISQTFWANIDVFICMQSAMALVKRGENIDRCFIGISPGGVGQSLFSSFIANMFGHLHAFFDPVIWYNDEEMRKQIENLEGCIIATAQEAPETNRKLREDLYKKTMSADGIAGRKPYGLVTRMLELVGWKRIEVNRMLRFSGVSESNFPSILRRSFVWKPKARFLDGAYLAEHYPEHTKDGIFPKDPNLKQQLASGPLIAAGLRSQHGFELRFTREQCREHIEKYAALGGDGGLTEDVMRSACGLPVRDRKAFVQAADAQLCAIPPDSQEIRTEQQDGLTDVLEAIVQHALAQSRDIYTPAMFK